MVLLLAGVLALVGMAELWRRLGNPTPEATRKLVHLGSGIGCMGLPFLVESPWVVFAFACISTTFFAVSQRMGSLPALNKVGRKTRGSEYYPLAIALIFPIAHDKIALYVSAIGVLAVADAFAALIGGKYGSIHFEVEDSQKSLEGSLMFFVIAFLMIHLPLLLLTDLPRAHCVLSAALTAALVTMFEAISLRGTDNLFIPVSVVVILEKLANKPTEEAVYQNLSFLFVAAFVTVLARRLRWFNAGATMALILLVYGAWALGSWIWALPLLLAMIGASLFGMTASDWEQGAIKVRYVAAVVLPAFLLILGGNVFLADQHQFFGPFLAVVASSAAFFATAHTPGIKRRFGVVKGVALGLSTWLLVALCPWLLSAQKDPMLLGLGACAVALAVVAEAGWSNLFGVDVQPRRWTARRFVFSFLAAGLFALGQVYGPAPEWDPDDAPNPQRLFWDIDAWKRPG